MLHVKAACKPCFEVYRPLFIGHRGFGLLCWLWWPCVPLLLRLVVIRIQGLSIACQYQVFEALQFLLLRIDQLQQAVLVGKADIGPNRGVAGGDAGEIAKA